MDNQDKTNFNDANTSNYILSTSNNLINYVLTSSNTLIDKTNFNDAMPQIFADQEVVNAKEMNLAQECSVSAGQS